MTRSSKLEVILKEIVIYPIKSAAGISLREASVEDRGLQFDRRWMLVDSTGMFMTQREHPRLALIKPQISGDTLTIFTPEALPIEVPLYPKVNLTMPVRIWGEAHNASRISAEADNWFGEFLGVPCQFVYMPEATQRSVDPAYAKLSDRVSFADGFPFLLSNSASLEDLNSRLDNPLPMNRFRPNLVVEGCAPYAEDHWRKIRVGEIIFRVVKPCARCTITTVDQATGRTGKEPLRTLSQYRRLNGKVMFGQNLLHDSNGSLQVGDQVHILSVES